MCFAFARTATTQRRLAAGVVVPAHVNVTTTTRAITAGTITTGTRWRMRLGVSD